MITIKGTPMEIWERLDKLKYIYGNITAKELMIEMWGELWVI